MVYVVIYFRPYVYGTKFTLVTDHRPLVWLHSVKDPTSRLIKWKLRLLEYDYQVVHKSGKINKNADALSRNPVSMCLPLIPRELKDPEFKIPVPKSVVDTNTIGQRIKQLRRDREKRPKYPDTSSSDEIGEPTLGKVQHSPIINRNRSLPSLSREVTMPDENQDTPHHFLPAANSTDIFSTEKDTSLSDDLISFDTPLENTVIQNTNNLQGDSPNVPQILFPETGGLLQPTVIGFPNNTVREASVRQPSDHTAEPYPFFDSSTDGSSTETDLEAPPEPKKGISISSDTLTAGEDHYVHFVSVDCNLITPVGKLLLDTGSINKQELLAARAKKGQVVISNNGLFKTFSIVISDNFYDKPKRIDVVNGLNTLRSTLEENRSKSFRISATGDHHELSANELLRTLKEVFVDSIYRITICNCVITTPSLENRQEIIQEAHDSLIGGHKGVTKTYNRVRSRFHWPHMRNEIQDYIRKCKSCQEQKLVRTKTRRPMLITDTPLDAFDKISLDTVGPLPITPGGNRHILTMQDNLTRYCIAVAIPNIRAATIADAFARHFIAIYGTPRAILTDKGTSFIGTLMTNLAEIFKIKQITTSGYRPQTNGSLERSHIVLTEYLKHYMENYEDWDLLIPFAMFSYNTSVHEATNFTPYELVFGKQAREPTSFPTGTNLRTYGDYLSELITNVVRIRNLAADNLNKAKMRSKGFYDSRARSATFNVGEFVYVLLEPRTSKFDPHYVGPYKIINVTDSNNVVLQTHNKIITKHQDKLKHAYFTSTAEGEHDPLLSTPDAADNEPTSKGE
ncbi:uncharacterized protein LOC143217410 [Lasioglossum baleicum]|uniref:uncharacterized protein LOC143217410 n=1 Tax=Lasioglossum baleicum TaxID=434251 RepID=UPI003FCCD068